MIENALGQSIRYIYELEQIRDKLTQKNQAVLFANISHFRFDGKEINLILSNSAKTTLECKRNIMNLSEIFCEDLVEVEVCEKFHKYFELNKPFTFTFYKNKKTLLFAGEPIKVDDKIDFYGHIQDITELLEIKTAIQNTSRNLYQYLKLLEEQVVTVEINIEGEIIEASLGFLEILNITLETIKNRNFYDLLDNKEQETLLKFVKKSLENGKIFKGELEIGYDETRGIWLDSVISPMYNENGKIIKFMLVAQNITSKKALEKLSIVDELTGVYNRRYFNEVIKEELSRQTRDKKTLTLIMLDIDFFKQYNDTYGHQEGDNVLKIVAKTLNSLLKRGGDYMFRLGGEEFGILFTGVDKKHSVEFAEQLRDAILNLKIPHSKNTVTPFVSGSFGVIVSNPSKEVVDEHAIYKFADDALYRAKKSGRNQVVLHEEQDIEIF